MHHFEVIIQNVFLGRGQNPPSVGDREPLLHLPPRGLWSLALFGKTCATTPKNVKSHVFLDFEKNLKKRKKTYT